MSIDLKGRLKPVMCPLICPEIFLPHCPLQIIIIPMATEIFVSPEEDAEISTCYKSLTHPFRYHKRDAVLYMYVDNRDYENVAGS